MMKDKNYCRACKSITAENFVDMETEEHLGTKYKILYFECTGIDLNEDAFSRILCQTCLRALIFSHEFTQMCKKTQRELEMIDFCVEETNCDEQNESFGGSFTDFHGEMEEDPIEIEEKMVCALCGSKFSELKLIRSHMKEVHKELKCKICRKIFHGSNFLASHKETCLKNDPKSPTCHFCDKIFSSISVLNRHIKTVHEKIRSFSCDSCSKSFQTKAHLVAHQSVHQSDSRSFTCEICSLTFKTDAVLKNHLKLHTATPNHVCDICGSKFKSATYLKIHKETHVTERAFICRVCRKCFKTQKTLRDHLTTHKEQEPLDCHVCGKKLKNKVTLKHHLRDHFSPGVACMDCGKTFSNKHVLRDHIATTHENTRNYICGFEGCDHAYFTSSHLNYHVKAVHLRAKVRNSKN
ncbi:gastrula zinc finger protein XlCGF26.1-like [Culicoides brevitarsis]|uniref:gastrula zinc finger protein XlCGF26.1-like n=1 Tax=Culicoides brevitarsis TaxID=469753 RepID=UPI00307B8118